MEIRQNSANYELKKNNGPMIHGQTDIVLKNVKTGLVERIHSENTFQGAFVAQYLHDSADQQTAALYSNSSFREAPWKGLVGGLLLFRDAITTGTEFMPAGNLMVGKAANGITNMSNPSELGSYNSIESSATGSAISQVFDFATNQANGNIGCVCLTSKEGGLIGYGNKSNTWYGGTVYSFGQMYGSQTNPDTGAVGILADNGKRYVFDYDSDSTVMTIKAYRTNGTAKGSVFAGLYTQTTHNLSTFPAALKNNTTKMVNYCGSNIFRIYPTNTAVAANATLDYMEYDASTDTLTAKQLTNSANYTIRTSSTYYSADKSGFTADGKYIAYKDGTPYSPVIFNLSTGVLEFDGTNALNTLGVTNSMSGHVQLGNGLYLMGVTKSGSGGYGAIIDLVNNTIKPVDFRHFGGSSGDWGGPTNFNNKYYQGSQIVGRAACVPVIRNPLYLATINNLDSAVTKTSAQTMKVTYTLTEA